ncbi:DUF2341 domain-containing protein [Frigoriglobus tundricola]|uniref:DUF2341 domain-containing protein n=1 Tax=Frigoriglobus tundricola TaxID=2774151 RepID=A0A6M5YWH1_9BACT|nr:DUF2341 domain-containing protein [Frigoriglobus tundricola]QJW98299.1 hypothetical protein FTUN_5887 [Frigoriglobus tundricola]
MKTLLALAAIVSLSRTAQAADYSSWRHTGSVYILTTPEGADLPKGAEVEGFPLLVRLHRDFFDFGQAQAHGEDLRVASAKGEPLAHQIEDWDATKGTASIWVRVPKIRGAERQEIKLYWGNVRAKPESDGKAVFGASNGYLSVWHMNEAVKDEIGTLASADTGTTATTGIIGRARHFPGQNGIFCGEKIPNYPTGASSHSTEAWVRAEKPNTTIIGWGNEGGGRGSKVRMQLRSPPHLHIDSDFSDVRGEGRVPLGEWVHVVHTYDRQDGRIYINGKLDATAKPLLGIKTPARFWIGGWYHNYDFVGDIDEVRVSNVARSADWVRLQYENQKPLQTLVGPLVQSGTTFSVSQPKVVVAEGSRTELTAKAGGAQKVYWVVKRDNPAQETVAAVDRFTFALEAGRVVGDQSYTLRFKAVYATEVKTIDVPVTVTEAVPEPVFTLRAPAAWDGRKTIEVVPEITNAAEMRAAGADALTYTWTAGDIAVIKDVVPGKLVLKRAQNSGPLTVTAAIHNGGRATERTVTIAVQEPAKDAWVERASDKDEKPEDGQFYARDDKNEGTLFYNGTLTQAAESVYLKLYADDTLLDTTVQKPGADKSYAFAVKLKAGLIRYKVEFGTRAGAADTRLHTVSNLVCGDAYLINGQSNAVATDFGKDDPTFRSDWIRSYGSMSGSPQGVAAWGTAVHRSHDAEKFQVGYWGMELARRLVETHKVPICLINGAVGGSRIDQHQRNAAAPEDTTTIYGRLLWRVRKARLTHGIRGVLWHQGENDQGADGPTGGFGWETYRQYFIDLAAAWKQDFPNVQHYYVFQIWPKSCSMGINGSDNRLREVQRTLPTAFSRLSVMSTLGIRPPGGCHFPAAGYAEFARLICPLLERDNYGKVFTTPVTPPNLKRAGFIDDKKDEILLEFDQPVKWDDALVGQFHLDGGTNKPVSGSASGARVRLKLSAPSTARTVTYLDSAAWSPDKLVRGANGIAALTFCEVPLAPGR